MHRAYPFKVRASLKVVCSKTARNLSGTAGLQLVSKFFFGAAFLFYIAFPNIQEGVIYYVR